MQTRNIILNQRSNIHIYGCTGKVILTDFMNHSPINNAILHISNAF